MGRFTGILGLVTMLGLAYAFSTNRHAIRLKTVAWGLGLQFVFAVFVLRIDAGRQAFQKAGDVVNRLLSYAFAGSQFVFGELGKQGSHLGFYFAFQVLPTIIFIAAFFAVLYHYGIMQFIIKIAAWVMTRVMGASGAESLNVAASIFMGQTEAPLTIRPFLPDLTRSELMTVMTSGMAHVSGGIMAAYIAFGIEPKHLLSAVIMTAPGTLLMAKMLVPETEKPKTAGRVVMSEDEERTEKEENLLGAVARGTTDGLHLALNIAAMLISFLALIALTNGVMGGIHNWLGSRGIFWFPESLEKIFGVLFAPVAWVIGIPWHDCPIVGNLLGTRMVLNELVAFSMLGPQRAVLDPRSFTIATFALCGFANLSSIGIQIGGIGALAPNKKGELARLGIRAMLAGTMANLMSASIAGMLL
ncbi:MAG: NupC/NupG family nucleoside CNT transporter [Acidobacteria bacterium]|jgi:CNT family concentrative nucleoside transporter|nr:MAG: NupC/NupG family nucleoside CNT transporter [Acidobacteriota bacterium]